MVGFNPRFGGNPNYAPQDLMQAPQSGGYGPDPSRFSGPGYQNQGSPDFASIGNDGTYLGYQGQAGLAPSARTAQYLAAIQQQPQSASAWNDQRAAYQQQVNQRAAAVPGNWQASYYAQQPQASVNIPDGKDSQQVQYDPRIAQQLTRQYFTPHQVGFGRIGNSLAIDGSIVTDDLAGEAQKAGMQPDAFIQHLVSQQQAQQPAWDMGSAIANARRSPLLNGLTGMQANAQITAAGGMDPQSYQQLQQKNQEASLAMMQKTQELQNSRQTGYSDAFKNLGADNPEEARTTYNTDPLHPNQFKVSGKYVADPIQPGKYIQTPDRWVYAQPEDFNVAVQRGLPLGYAQMASGQQIAQERAEHAQLRALKNQSAPAVAPPPAQAAATPAGISARQAAITGTQNMGTLFGNAVRTTENSYAVPAHGAISAYNFLRQFATGNADGDLPQPNYIPWQPFR